MSVNFNINEELIIRKLESKLARQEQMVAETKQHINAMREIQKLNDAKSKEIKK